MGKKKGRFFFLPPSFPISHLEKYWKIVLFFCYQQPLQREEAKDREKRKVTPKKWNKKVPFYNESELGKNST